MRCHSRQQDAQDACANIPLGDPKAPNGHEKELYRVWCCKPVADDSILFAVMTAKELLRHAKDNEHHL